MENAAQLVEQFVAELNSRGPGPLPGADVPRELRTSELEIRDWFRWQIRAANDNPWIPELEAKLPFQLPPLYRLLITRFRFAEFEVGPVMFFGNTGTEIDNELSRAMFADRWLSPFLLEHGFVQFGRQAGGGYDPVCFDGKRRKQGDAPIVRIDHEDVLIKQRVRVVAEIAPSFQAFVEQILAGKFRSQ